jgi:hypothetical protein
MYMLQIFKIYTHPTTGYDSQPQQFYNLERNPVPIPSSKDEPLEMYRKSCAHYGI